MKASVPPQLGELLSRIDTREAAPLTPLQFNAHLSEVLGCTVMLKCEHLLPGGSFKYRGAIHKVRTLGATAKRGLVAASTGNHGKAVALAAAEVNAPVRVFVPESASPVKLDAIRALGVEVVRAPGSALASEGAARAWADANGWIYVSPYNDLDIMAGHATMGIELLQQAPGLDAVFLSVGGGGLLGGVGAAIKARSDRVRMIGCWPANADAFLQAIKAGRMIDVVEGETLSDGTVGGAEAGAVTLPICSAVLDEAVQVTEPEIASAMRLLAEHANHVVEGAAGVAFAGLIKNAERFAGQTVAVVLCGGNVGADVFRKVTGLSVPLSSPAASGS